MALGLGFTRTMFSMKQMRLQKTATPPPFQNVAALAALNADVSKASNSTKVAHKNAQNAEDRHRQNVAALDDEDAPDASDFDPFGMLEKNDEEARL